jgi:hypothetical protein
VLLTSALVEHGVAQASRAHAALDVIIGSAKDRHVASGRADKTMQGRYRLERKLY